MEAQQFTSIVLSVIDASSVTTQTLPVFKRPPWQMYATNSCCRHQLDICALRTQWGLVWKWLVSPNSGIDMTTNTRAYRRKAKAACLASHWPWVISETPDRSLWSSSAHKYLPVLAFVQEYMLSTEDGYNALTLSNSVRYRCRIHKAFCLHSVFVIDRPHSLICYYDRQTPVFRNRFSVRHALSIPTESFWYPAHCLPTARS